MFDKYKVIDSKVPTFITITIADFVNTLLRRATEGIQIICKTVVLHIKSI